MGDPTMSRRPTGRGLPDLNQDYAEVWARLDEAVRSGSCDDVSLLDRLRVYRRFTERQGHRIGPYPHALLPIAHAEPLDSPVRADAVTLEASGKGPAPPWFRRLHPPPTDLNPALVRILQGHTKRVNSVALSDDGRTAISGSWDGTVRVWDLEVRGHA